MITTTQTRRPCVGRNPVFRFRVWNAGLAPNQFLEMVNNHLRCMCDGILYDLYSDYKPSYGQFWDSETWDAPASQGNAHRNCVREGLEFFARRYLQQEKLSDFNGSIAPFIRIEDINSSY